MGTSLYSVCKAKIITITKKDYKMKGMKLRLGEKNCALSYLKVKMKEIQIIAK